MRVDVARFNRGRGMKAFFGVNPKLQRRLMAAALSALSAAVLAAGAAASGMPAVASEQGLRPLDESELGLIERLNGDRQLLAGGVGEPLRRLTSSTALTQAASDYADYLRFTGRFDHQADGRTAAARALQAGWNPAPGSALAVSEALAEGSSAEAAYSAWKSSPSHAAVIFHPGAQSVGLGHSANKWVLLVGGQCVGPDCGMTTDWARASADSVPRRTPHLRFFLRRTGRRVTVLVRVLKGEGRVLVRVRRSDGRSARRLRVRRRGDLWRYSFRLSSRGRWSAVIRFKGAEGWTGKVLRLRPFTVSD